MCGVRCVGGGFIFARAHARRTLLSKWRKMIEKFIHFAQTFFLFDFNYSVLVSVLVSVVRSLRVRLYVITSRGVVFRLIYIGKRWTAPFDFDMNGNDGGTISVPFSSVALTSLQKINNVNNTNDKGASIPCISSCVTCGKSNRKMCSCCYSERDGSVCVCIVVLNVKNVRKTERRRIEYTWTCLYMLHTVRKHFVVFAR